MFRILGYVFVVVTVTNCLSCQQNQSQITSHASDSWTSLFDGSSLDKWQSSTTEENIPICWRIKDGELINIRKNQRSKDIHASLLTKEQFSNFELRFEFILEAPTQTMAVNSGVKYFVYPNTELGLEYQIYARIGEVDGPHAIADLYDILSAAGAELKPFNEWNSARISSRGNKCEHWLNGTKVLTFERGSETFRQAIAKSKFKNRENFGEAQAGYIMLQDHGGGIRFRNILIKEL